MEKKGRITIGVYHTEYQILVYDIIVTAVGSSGCFALKVDLLFLEVMLNKTR